MAEAIDDSCLAAGLKLLSIKDRFTAELQAMLLDRGFQLDQIGPVLDHLARRKLLDDRRSIETYFESKSGRKSLGRERIRTELVQRGAPEELIDEALSSWSAEDERATILAVLGSRFSPSDDRNRGARFLLSRGFQEDVIEGILDEFFSAETF